MPKKTDSINLNLLFNTKTRELSINTNASPPEVLELITMVQAQLVPVFLSLDTQLQSERDKTSLIVPQPGSMAALGIRH